jgi:hypothetical protein
MSDRGRRGGQGRRAHTRGRGRGRGGNLFERHNGERQHAREAAPARIEETEEQRQARWSYNSWKRLLHEPADNPGTRRRLWEGALSILEAGDRDWRQRLPQDLNDDDGTGFAHILALLGTKACGTDYKTFINNARNFLLTITHSSLLHCLAVDTHVGIIYNLFAGVCGTRAVSFLKRLIEALLAAPTAKAAGDSTEDAKNTLLAMSTALFELLRREPRARFNDEIPALVDFMQTAIDFFKDDASSNSLARTLSRLDNIRALLARAQGLLADESVRNNNAADDEGDTSFYPRDLIVPSNRFDNDKKDIADIILFPTRDEIMSDAEEFLPYTDPDQPHFLDDPVQRHIDTFFRLLRHDIFGELKGALAGIMHTVAQNPAALLDANLNLGDMRAYHYVNARISYVTLDTRKGLQA